MKRTAITGFILFSSFTSSLFAQSSFAIITSDVVNFWNAFDSLKFSKDTVGIFQRNVIDKASPQFKIFIKQRNITATNYLTQARAFPKFYSSLRENSFRINKSEKEIRLLVEKFKAIYPDFKEADFVIAFGNFTTGGTIAISEGNNYVFVGLEFHGLDSSANITELNAMMQDYVSRSNFFKTVIHELVHIQQYSHGSKVKRNYSGDRLAHSIIKEGVPDFVASLVYISGNKGNNVEYGLKNEEKLKEKLKNDLWQKDFSYWIFNSNTATNQPRDLGYFIGSRIAKSYYTNNFRSVKATVKEIIEVKDLKRFIEKSKYFD